MRSAHRPGERVGIDCLPLRRLVGGPLAPSVEQGTNRADATHYLYESDKTLLQLGSEPRRHGSIFGAEQQLPGSAVLLIGLSERAERAG